MEAAGTLVFFVILFAIWGILVYLPIHFAKERGHPSEQSIRILTLRNRPAKCM